MAKVIALIPARGGSKGIPGKNIVPVAGAPLLSYSILAAKKSTIFDSIYVSSDDENILYIAQHFDAKTIVRDSFLAKDETPTNPVIENVIQLLALEAQDIIVLLQPTSPLRTAEHIKIAFSQFVNTPQCNALMSVAEIEKKYLYSFTLQDGFLQSISEKHSKISRRQELPALYLPNGAIYIFSVEKFMKGRSIPTDSLVPFVMDEESSLDIDTYDDLAIAEEYLLKKCGQHD